MQRESDADDSNDDVDSYFRWDLFDDGIDIDDVVFGKAFVARTGRFVGRLVLIFAHGELQTGFSTERTKNASTTNSVFLNEAIDIITRGRKVMSELNPSLVSLPV